MKLDAATKLGPKDEPTTGLHFADIQRLLEVLNRLVEAGNTVLVIEHNLDVIRHADWIIDLGPEGGDHGGEIVAEGAPRELARVKRSYAGQVLYDALWSMVRKVVFISHLPLTISHIFRNSSVD